VDFQELGGILRVARRNVRGEDLRRVPKNREELGECCVHHGVGPDDLIRCASFGIRADAMDVFLKLDIDAFALHAVKLWELLMELAVDSHGDGHGSQLVTESVAEKF